MGKNVKGVVIVVFAAAIGLMLINHVVNHVFSKNIMVGEDLNKMAEDINRNLPMLLDSETRFDSVYVIEDTLIYQYTMVNYSIEELDVDVFKEHVLLQLKKGYCTSAETKAFLKKNVSVSYVYYGNEGKQLADFKLSPSDCKN